MHPFDHFIYAARDLSTLRQRFEHLAGVVAALGGSHPDLGTHNALAALGDDIYFELMAANPGRSSDGYLGAAVAAIDMPRLFGWMLRAEDLESLARICADAGVETDLFAASRTTPTGQVLRWRLLMPRPGRFGRLLPNFIDWQGTTPHPARSSPAGCTFRAFALGHPDAVALNHVLAALDAPVRATGSDRAWMQLTLDTPHGALALTCMADAEAA